MDYTRSINTSTQESVRYDEGLRAYMIAVFNNMAIGLGITGVVAFLTSVSPELQRMLFATPLAYVIMFAPLIMCFFIGSSIMNSSIERGRMMFAIFASLMGLSIGSIFMIYTNESIARTFFITASVFGAMSLYGYTTKKDLTSMGSFLIMGLIGILIAGLVNIFLASSMLHFVISVVSVIIFVGLTAYDTQMLKNTYYEIGGEGEMIQKAATLGALTLYMDFINLFMALLRFFGDRKE